MPSRPNKILSAHHDRGWAQLQALDDSSIPLDEAALLIAADHNPDLDVDACLAELDALADRLRPRLSQAVDPLERLQTLATFLFVELGFGGNEDAYYEPENSFLDQVLQRRQGVPISLAVLAMEVGRRVGLRLVGVSFPAHFLVKDLELPDLYLDAFNGVLMTRRDCEALLDALSEGSAAFEDRLLKPASTREVLLRMLRNLKAIFVDDDEFGLALQAVDRMLLLAPGNATELRDRGLLRLRTHAYATGLADLEHYLKLNPADPNHEALLATIATTRKRMWSLN